MSINRRSSACKRAITGLVCAALLASGTAWAQSSPDELARRHFESGVAYLQESDYDNALKAFQKAYELSKRPEVLLNIATVHERMGKLDKAVGSLEEYLKLEPNGEHAETVKLRIANLKKRLEEEPPPPEQPPVKPAPAPAKAEQPKPAPQPLPPPAADQPPDEGPNVPALVLIGVGGAATIGAVVTGLIANSKHSDAEAGCGQTKTCTDDELSSGRTMAWTSTALTGVAIVGVAVGVTLLLTSSPKSEKSARAPDLFIGAGPRGAAAEARWAF